MKKTVFGFFVTIVAFCIFLEAQNPSRQEGVEIELKEKDFKPPVDKELPIPFDVACAEDDSIDIVFPFHRTAKNRKKEWPKWLALPKIQIDQYLGFRCEVTSLSLLDKTSDTHLLYKMSVKWSPGTDTSACRIYIYNSHTKNRVSVLLKMDYPKEEEECPNLN